MTPGIKPTDNTWEEGDEDDLTGNEASRYRVLVARASYISQDRTDIAYVTKELSRGMSRPTVGNMKALKRLSRYLKGKETSVLNFRYQSNSRCIYVWVDTGHQEVNRRRYGRTWRSCNKCMEYNPKFNRIIIR